MGAMLGLGRQVFAALPRILLERTALLTLVAVLAVVFQQYFRLARAEQALYGAAKNDPWLQTGMSLVYGTIGGVVISLTLALSGLALVPGPEWVSPLPYLGPVAVALSLLRPRYLCVAYAGCVLSVVALVARWPRIDVASTCALIGAVHLAEGLLVALTAPTCASPVTVQGRDGLASAGFVLRRFWPLPLVVPLGATAVPGANLVLVPFVAGLGYSDLAVSSPARRRAARTGAAFGLYGLALLGLSLLAARWSPALWLAATFCGAGHEALALWSRQDEVVGLPHLRRPGRGVGVLDVFPGTVADAAGLSSGAVILAIGGVEVRTRADVQRAFRDAPAHLEVVFRDGKGLHNCRVPRPAAGAGEFGAIFLPEPGDAAQLHVGARGWVGPHSTP